MGSKRIVFQRRRSDVTISAICLHGLRAAGLKTARAWAIKEMLRHLWKYKHLAWAEKYWKRWYFWATHCRLRPVKKVASTLKHFLYGILDYCKHRITNAMTEGINSRIETLWKSSCGFRNKERFRTVIFSTWGALSFIPTENPEGPLKKGGRGGFSTSNSMHRWCQPAVCIMIIPRYLHLNYKKLYCRKIKILKKTLHLEK